MGVVKRWTSKRTNNGVVVLQFPFPSEPRQGWWWIKVRAANQVEYKRFKLTLAWPNKFEAFVTIPSYMHSSEDEIAGELSSGFRSDEAVYGNATLRLFARLRPG